MRVKLEPVYCCRCLSAFMGVKDVTDYCPACVDNHEPAVEEPPGPSCISLTTFEVVQGLIRFGGFVNEESTAAYVLHSVKPLRSWFTIGPIKGYTACVIIHKGGLRIRIYRFAKTPYAALEKCVQSIYERGLHE